MNAINLYQPKKRDVPKKTFRSINNCSSPDLIKEELEERDGHYRGYGSAGIENLNDGLQ